MPKGPRGEQQPANVIGMSVMVAKIATEEVEDNTTELTGWTRSGKAGAAARAQKLTLEERSTIAKKAVSRR